MVSGFSRFRAIALNTPLRPTIGLALIVGLSLPVAVAVWRHIDLRRETLLEQLQADHARLAEVVAIGMQQPIWDIRPDTGQPLIEAIMRDGRVSGITVKSQLTPEFLSTHAPGPSPGAMLHRDHPVIRDGERIGSVQVTMNTAELDAEISRQWAQVLVTGGLQLAFGLLLLFPLLRFKVLDPVDRLLAQSRSLAEGALDRPLVWDRGDELGALGRSFEDMRQALAGLVADLETRNTELREREADLQRRRAVLRAILDNMTDGVTLTDEDRRLQRWNGRFTEIMRMPSDFLYQGMPVEELAEFDIGRGRVLEEDRESFLAELRASFRSGKSYSSRRSMIDGQHVNIRRRPMPGGGFVSTFTDVTEQVEAQRKAEETLRLLESVMEAVPAVVHVKDRELRYRFVNRQFSRWWGVEREKLLGKTNREVFPPHMFPDTDARDRYVLDTGQALGFYEGICEQGAGAEPIITWTMKVPLFDADGRTDAVLTVDFDISDRKRMEQERQRWVQLFQDAIESIPNGFAIYDSEKRLVVCNSAFALVYGEPPESLQGIHAYDLIPRFLSHVRSIGGVSIQTWQETVPDQLAEYWNVGARGPMDVELVNGRWVMVSRHPTQEGGFVWLRTDITELKRMQQELRESEQRFRGIVVAAADAVVSASDDGRIIEFNPAAERMFGRRRHDTLGRKISDVLVPEHLRERHEAGMARLRRNERSRVSGHPLELEAVRANGELFPIELTITEVPLEGRRQFTAFIRDITDRRRAEQELERHREALHQSEKLSALGSLLAGVAHELNNPLSVVVGRSVMLEERFGDSDAGSSVRRLRAAAERCARIVKAFLALARQQDPVRVRVEIGEVIQSALDLVGSALRTDGVDVSVDIAPSLPEIDADPDQLSQVFVNLFVNAQHAMTDHDGPKRLEIDAWLDPAEDRLRIRVRDTGPGVDPTLLSRIFEPFFTTKDVGEGTGLGLSVSHGIIESHGGEITAEVADGGGLAFTIALPVDGIPTTASSERRAHV